MKKTRKHLALHKEIVRDLTVDELKQVPGGLSNGHCTGSVNCTIPTTSSTCPKSE